MALDVLRTGLRLPAHLSVQLVIDSAAAAHTCASAISDFSDASVRAQALIRLSKAFDRIGNCAKRAPANLRKELDQALAPLVRQQEHIDIEAVEAIFEVSDRVLAEHTGEEAADTALSALGSRHDGEGRRITLKLDFETLSSLSQDRVVNSLSALMTSSGGELTASEIFHRLADACGAETAKVDPRIGPLITDYVAVVAGLWRAHKLKPSRAVNPSDPRYVSHFHRFVELVLTAIVEPWARRHDEDIGQHAEAVRQARARLSREYKQAASARLPRTDVQWLVSEDHVRNALKRPLKKSTHQTP
jgi:hypothetical protein